MIDWISVDERLPDDSEIKLVYCQKQRGYDFSYFWKQSNRWVYISAYGLASTMNGITHWAKINEPRNNKVGLPDLKLLEGRN